MRLKLKTDDKTEIVDVDQSTKVEDLRAIVVSKFDLRNFELSLNKKDFFGDENSYLCQLSFLGITDGDIIYVTNLDRSETNQAQNASKNVAVASTTPKQTAASLIPSCSRSTENPKEINYLDVKKYETNLVDSGSTNELESLVVLINSLLIEKGFRQKDGTVKLPDTWRSSSSNGFFRLNFCHPSSDVELQLTVVANPAQVGGKLDSVAIDGRCKVGDNWESVRHEIILSKICPNVIAESPSGHFLNLNWLITDLKNSFVDEVTIKVVGYVDCLLLQLPDDIVEKIILRHFSLKMFKNLTETCRKMQKLWDDEKIWMHFLKRDFGDEAVNRAKRFGTCCKKEYETMYKAQKEREQRQSDYSYLVDPAPYGPRPWNPYPPGYDPWNPMPQRPFFPTIGGPEDLWPAGNIHQPLPLGRGPNIRPRLPFNPNPLFPGNNPSRHPNPDYPHYPGGGGFI